MQITIPPEIAHDPELAKRYADNWAEGARLERARIKAILTSEAGLACPAMARAIAMQTDMTPEAATAFMTDLPVEKSMPSFQQPAGVRGFDA